MQGTNTLAFPDLKDRGWLFEGTARNVGQGYGLHQCVGFQLAAWAVILSSQKMVACLDYVDGVT